ncbi:MAG TPA: outer membrane protein assembly factor BamD [Steroidobacteraceae bacterium]|nr:outer membrane protein assembly factor BamD [Steroidobacteraceae bacterium]
MLILLCAACALTAGCKSADRKLQKASPEVLYKQAQSRLNNFDYNGAIKIYEMLNARFPFTDQARQARLDLIYAYYRQGEHESAIDAADTFIRENPTHPRVDYAWYIKGLVDYERAPNVLERFFHADLSERPPTTANKSFEAFRTVVEQFPKSDYAHDARRRMIYLRNRLADYDVHVAEYYMQRGAWVGAAQRATHAVETYDGAPSIREALLILMAADEKLGLTERETQVREVFQANFGEKVVETRATTGKPWWKFW